MSESSELEDVFLKYKDESANVVYFADEVNGMPMVCYVIPNAIVNMTPQPYYIYAMDGWKPLKEGEI